MKLTHRFYLILCALILTIGSARGQSSLWTNLVSYWPFDTAIGGSTPDLAVGNNLILSNSPVLVAGERGNAFQFNGTSQFLGLVHSSNPADTGLPIYYSTTGYTIAFWVNGNSTQANNKTVFSEGNLGNSGLLLNFATEGAKLRLFLRNDAGGTVINNYFSKATTFDNTWHFVAWSDTNGTGTLYIDGTVDFQTNYIYSLAGGLHANDDSVGALYRAAPANFFAGLVDELALWNRVLSPAEVQSFMTNSIPTPIPPIAPVVTAQPANSTNDLGDRVTFSAHIFGAQPVSYQWLSNNVPLVGQTNNTLTLTDLTVPGTNFYALAGSNVGGSITSTPAMLVVLPDPAPNVPASLVSYWPFDTIAYSPVTNSPDLYSQENMVLNLMDSNNLVPGVFGNALSFDGATQYGAVTGATPIYNLGSTYTVAFWVKGAAGQADKQVFANGNSSGNYFFIGTDNTGASGKLDVSVQPGMGDTLSTGTVFDGTWHHVVWVDQNGAGLLYIDGVLDPTAFNYTRGSAILNNTTVGALLANTLRDYFAGSIDDLGVWSRRLTYTEIQTIRTNGIPAPTGPVKPTIFSLTTQPSNVSTNVYQGDTVSFTAQAGGTLPLNYQWLKNNSPISGTLNPTALSNTLVLTNVQPTDSSPYSVIVGNSGGSVTSSVVSLTVTAYTPVTNGVALQLEFNNSSAGPVQSGFSSMNLSGNPASFNGPEVTLGAIGNTSLSSRARTTPVNNPPGLTTADIYDQFVFSTANTAGTGMDIQINRLAPNTAYELTLWSFDQANQELEDWTEVASGTPVVIQNGYRFNGSTLPTADYQDTMSSIVISSPQGDLDIQGVVDPANTGNAGVFLNALVLVATNSQIPQIAQQPQSATLTQGNAFTNTVVAWGQYPLSYQWYETNLAAQTGYAMPGQTNASLVFNSVQSSNTGDYYVVITNANGSVMSETVELAVYSTPVILQAFTNLLLFAGANPVFSVSVAGVAPLNYQWISNGVPIGGATNAAYTQPNLQSGATNYACIITNSLGSVTDLVSVTTIPAPTNSYPQAVLAANPIGYWRLNEQGTDGQTGPNDGVIANDYWGGHDGVYTNMSLGWPGYNPTQDPSDTSAQFGLVNENNDYGDSEANSIAGINFETRANTSTAFSVEAWVNGYPQDSDAGMVTLGFGNGGEQFDLDTGANDPSHDFRFLIRDASGGAHAVNSSIAPVYGIWYHLVGVVDEISNQNMVFYLNGQSVGTASVPSGSGMLFTTNLMSIGSRMSGQGTTFDDQFNGNINDVAVFNYALSASQVAGQYVAGATNAAPFLVPPPETNAAGYATSTLAIPATAYGTGPMGYVWTNLNTGAIVASGVTNATSLNAALNYGNVPASWNGDQLELIVTNSYGSTNALVTLSIANVNLNPTNVVIAVTNNQLSLSWPADHIGWQLQAQTNRLSVGLGTNWVNVTGSMTTNQVVLPINLTNGSVFYRLTGP